MWPEISPSHNTAEQGKGEQLCFSSGGTGPGAVYVLKDTAAAGWCSARAVGPFQELLSLISVDFPFDLRRQQKVHIAKKKNQNQLVIRIIAVNW